MHRRTYILSAALSLAAATASAQQLFEFAPTDEGPASVRAFSASGASDTGPAIQPVAIKLDASLLAQAPERIAFPSLAGAGSTTWLQLRHFEKRADGLTWSGGPEGAAVETSVLTVHNGHTVGTLLAADGKRFEIQASPSGEGRIVENGEEPDWDWCFQVDQVDPVDQAPPPLSSAGATRSAQTAGGESVIDILFVSSPRARSYWQRDGKDPNAVVLSWIDYGNMIFRNSRIDARLNAVDVGDAFGSLFVEYSPVTNLDFQLNALAQAQRQFKRLQALRSEYRADIVHVVAYSFFAEMQRLCGIANLYLAGETPQDMAAKPFSYTDLNCAIRSPGHGRLTFIHELGHNLGGQHNREIPHLAWGDGSREKYSYGFLSNPRAKLDDPFRKPVNLANTGAVTIMAYDPGEYWYRVPYFSTPGIDLSPGDYGAGPLRTTKAPPRDFWRLGKVNYANNAKMFRDETAHDLSRLSDYLFRLSHAPEDPEVAAATDNGDGTVTLEVVWRDVSQDEHGFRIVGEVYASDGSASQSFYRRAIADIPGSPFFPSDNPSEVGRRSGTWTFQSSPQALAVAHLLGDGDSYEFGIDVLSVNIDGGTASGTLFVGPVIRPSAPTLTVDVSSAETIGEAYVTVGMERRAGVQSVKVIEESRAVGTAVWETVPDDWKAPSDMFVPGSDSYVYTVFVGSGYEFRVTVTTTNEYGTSEPVSLSWSIP